jgi:hypothetical protein
MVLHLGRLLPYPKILDLAGKVCQGQTLLLITKICKLHTKTLNNNGSRVSTIKHNTTVIHNVVCSKLVGLSLSVTSGLV